MKQAYALRSVTALAMAVAAFLGQAPHSAAFSALKRIHDPGHVTYSIRLTTCHARDRGKLPDPSCTPGSIDPAVTQRNIHSTICRAGWTARVRPPEAQTQQAKYRVAYPAYHIPTQAQSELDHLVPLELGGSNDITNLWPEVGRIPNPKDSVENALNHAVCDGRVSLTAAQNAIASDWLKAEARLGIRGAWCRASAAYNAQHNDYDIYVHSNQPNRSVTATASNGATRTWYTDATGYADIYLYANPGDTVKVTVGSALCSTTT